MPELIDKKVAIELLEYLDMMLEFHDACLRYYEKYGYGEQEVHDSAEEYYEAKRTIVQAINVEAKGQKYYYDILIDKKGKHTVTKVEL